MKSYTYLDADKELRRHAPHPVMPRVLLVFLERGLLVLHATPHHGLLERRDERLRLLCGDLQVSAITELEREVRLVAQAKAGELWRGERFSINKDEAKPLPDACGTSISHLEEAGRQPL
eukprot:scaffold1006_cov270-Pinguiococcus_pyrenoidosus.AAC.26